MVRVSFQLPLENVGQEPEGLTGAYANFGQNGYDVVKINTLSEHGC